MSADISNQDLGKPKGYRAALFAVIILGVLLFAGLAVLVAGLVGGWGTHAETAAPKSNVHPVITLPAGYTILSTDTQPGRLILHVRSPDRDQILIVDTDDGSIVAEINAPASK